MIDLNARALEALNVIRDHPGWTISQVANRLGRDEGHTRSRVNELVAAKLITRVMQKPKVSWSKGAYVYFPVT